MIISEHFIYFELHKSGCSHTRKILLDTPDLAAKEHGKHNSYQEVDAKALGDMRSKLKVGGIRNPWDWYVSMWAFGCMGKGRFRQNVEELPLHLRGWAEVLLRNPGFLFPRIRKEWRSVYSDAQNPQLFQKWLSMVYDRSRMNDPREGFKQTPISRYGGLMTYRYMRLYTYDFITNRNKIPSMNELIEYDARNNFIDLMIRTEDIDSGILQMYSKLGIDESITRSIIDRHSKRTNTSDRKGYREYYNDESHELVSRVESFLIDKYDYSY